MSAPIFINGQWAVIDYGMTTVRPGAPYEYNIDAPRLLTRSNGYPGGIYDWPYHMAEKTWIDIEAFIAAYQKAIDHHHPGEADAELLEQTYAMARKRAAENARPR